MNKQKTIITWCVLGLIIFEELLKYKYYKYLFGSHLNLGDRYNALDLAGALCALILNCFMLILAIRSLGDSDAKENDRAYSMLRYVFVMKLILIFPISMFRAVFYAGNVSNIGYTILFYFRIIAAIVLAVFLIRYKPEKPVENVNLREYDYVTFTSGAHRFAHYLLDMLFLVPFWVFMIQNLVFTSRFFNHYYAGQFMELILQFLMLTSYLFYCFLSEAIFRQTLGKMVTRSVVVSDGVKLSTGRIFLRTLARLIPFDKISFLFGAKWHDRASSTAVVYIDTWEKAFAETRETAKVTA
jgi:uncharacterized RDD family membrane protein YckC